MQVTARISTDCSDTSRVARAPPPAREEVRGASWKSTSRRSWPKSRRPSSATRRRSTATTSATLDELFWNSPHTLRYGVGEQLYGYDQIAAFRAGRDPGFVVDRDLLKLWIVTYGRDFGTANCEFRRHGANRTGRQSHTWMRTPEGWRIVAAHVSLLGEATVMKSLDQEATRPFDLPPRREVDQRLLGGRRIEAEDVRGPCATCSVTKSS